MKVNTVNHKIPNLPKTAQGKTQSYLPSIPVIIKTTFGDVITGSYLIFEEKFLVDTNYFDMENITHWAYASEFGQGTELSMYPMFTSASDNLPEPHRLVFFVATLNGINVYLTGCFGGNKFYAARMDPFEIDKVNAWVYVDEVFPDDLFN